MSKPRPDRLPASKVASHLGVMLVVSAVLGVVVSGLAIPFAGVLGFTARNVSETIDDLPQELETEQLPQRTVIQDKAGNTIATIYDQYRINVDLRNISRTMVKAIVSIEDYRFYQHGALDLKGTMRALFTNQAADGVVQGGSSITQQLVKLTLQNQAIVNGDEEAAEAATDDTYARKLRELRYAIALEKEHSKDWILERYLNTAYFGDGAYGVQAAAQHYFNVNAKDLNLAQSALLAGLVQSPEAFDPTENEGAATERRNIVLDRMAELNVISEEKAERTKKVKVRSSLDVQEQSNGCVNSSAPFFCSYVLEYLKRDPALGRTKAARERLLWGGGLTITTTIDTRMQAAAQQSVSSHVFPREGALGALALVEPGTGEVKALAQSRPMGTNARAGQTFLNYTVPTQYGDANGFQSGSTFKTFVLASAIDQGISLNTTISAPAQKLIPENSYRTCDGTYRSSALWDVKNFDGQNHSANLYTGTRLSVNTFFAQLEQQTGLCKPYRLAQSMGVRLTDPAREMVPTFTLGIADVSPLELAEAYATFAGRGLHCDSRPVERIEDSRGNLLKDYQPICNRALPEAVADAVNDVLRGVIAPGGFGAALAPGVPAAGKTGTTSSNRAVWFAGYTPNLAGAATVAGLTEAGEPEALDGKVIGGVTQYSTSGSGTAGPIWGDAFKAIAPILAGDDFVAPDQNVIRGVQSTVPSVAGLSVSAATAALEAEGFIVANGGSVNSNYASGLVAYASQPAGAQYPSGSTITIYVSNGVPPKPPKNDNKGGGGNNGGRGNGHDGDRDRRGRDGRH